MTMMLADYSFGGVSSVETSSFQSFDFAGFKSFSMPTLASQDFSGTAIEWLPQVETFAPSFDTPSIGSGDLAEFSGFAPLAEDAMSNFELAPNVEFVADFASASPVMPMMDASASMMEALLTLAPENTADIELAEVASLNVAGQQTEIGTILDDVMAGNSIDTMLDAIAGDMGEVPVLADAVSYLAMMP